MIDMVGDGVVVEKVMKLNLTVGIDADKGGFGERVVAQMVECFFQTTPI